jgi:hypothetical protein
MYRNVILHIVLCGCETCSFILREDHSGVQEWCAEEVIWAVINSRRKLHCEEHHDLFSSSNITGMIKSMKFRVGGTCGMDGEEERCM